ncbi:MAG: VIT1/CCC1 transporter family protein [Armatimonadota bacterium]|nr:VIT1/CCC1 transporter family protein [Armatimonadota bacterium]MDR7437684.1 VIT1/CCC1 transporter family protein [Armatimonadota bacterium]MDR7472403.1 VIT1/CCC1 transporter family protein [Armatimonadota bacterium]MDR7507527.1 VIT1/CCC1 transporter family protein [Armatimonadota bacterium]MDR7509786.1 VIT1/CCC1 transporter family protein [Armatimonadota bacterium]
MSTSHPPSPSRSEVAAWRDHWQDEGDAAFLYRRLAAAARDPRQARLFAELAEVEEQHAARWADLLRAAGVSLPAHRPSLRARLTALLGRAAGWAALAGLLLAEEGRETRGYLRGAARYRHPDAAAAAARLARESAEHAARLAGMAGGAPGEPWHRIASGGFLRNAVYGFNDGLTANFGLVMGVLGANAPAHLIIVSGVAGLIADALSMGSSSYLAATSEREVYAHEIAMEREELRVMPDLEEAELAILYQARGMTPEAAALAAREVMRHPDRALQEQVQMELGIGQTAFSPLREGGITGMATAVGALIPVIPFLVLDGAAATWTSFAVSMLSHFLVGAARSVFTGRSALRSGLDMFLVGLGIAAVGFVAGEQVARLL